MARQGDRAAFDALVLQHEEVAFRAAYLIVRDEDEAADVAQDAFVRAYRSLKVFDPSRPFRPWLLRIVTNLALNSTRAGKRRDAAVERLAVTERRETEPPPDAAAEAAEQSARVWDAVSQLAHDDQRIIYLRYFLEASEAETAVTIGRPAGTVKSRLHRALKRLRSLIEEAYPDLLPHTSPLLREEQHEPAANS